MCQQRDMIEKLKQTTEQLKTDALADKTAIIKLQSDVLVSMCEQGELQDKLLECKDKQLKSLQTAVETTVQATVQKEFQSYSDKRCSGQ